MSKFNVIFTLALLFFIGFSSCKKITNIPITTDLTDTETIELKNTSGVLVSFNESSDIDLSNEDTEESLDKIKDIDINSLKFTLRNFTGDPLGIIQDLKINGANIVAGTVVVKTAVDDETVFEVTDVTTLDAIAKSLVDTKKATVALEGKTKSDADMKFDAEFTMNVTVTLNPLE